MAFRQRTSGRKKKTTKRKSKVVLSRNPQRFEAVEKESKTEQASEPAMGVGYKIKKNIVKKSLQRILPLLQISNFNLEKSPQFSASTRNQLLLGSDF